MTTSPSNEIPSSRSATSQSIFSRIASPFSGKNRSFADFDINLDEPLREYRAGDAVKGSIQLAVPKPLRITHLVLSLHGFAKVYKNAAAPGDGLPSEVKTPTPGRGKAGVEYLGNGLVSLFEDEIILCGGGKLNLGKYSFRFEARFPSRSLPSSLSFERGTISYVLVATLTRPTSIVPSMSREKTIPFKETIDIAYEAKPKTRKLHLKALNRPRNRGQPKRTLTDRTTNSTSNTNRSSPNGSDHHADERPRSSNASENSHGSGLDSITLQTVQTPSRATLSIELPNSPVQSTTGIISATVDVLKGGFLPGDYIPIRISIKHTRAIKSMQGIIVTLYRKAKIDGYPIIQESKGPLFEDPVPKSRTGLKGLTLSGRASHMFRMDLAQAFAPMIINPGTLEADIKTAVKIPEETFPTVTSVPGQMIVFTYHVEVIMDLGGKLSSQDRLFSGLNMTKKAPGYSVGAKTSGAEFGLPSMQMYHLIDTSEVKREKGVAQETIPVVIGSVDSRRKVGDTKKVDLWLHDDLVSNFSGPEESPSERLQEDTRHNPQYAVPQYTDMIQPMSPSALPPQLSVSEFQEPTDEKSRIRLAEQRLLPSAPPPESEDFASSSRTVPFAVPSAPPISDFDSYYPANHVTGAPDFEVLGVPAEDEIAPAYQRETNGSINTITRDTPLSPDGSVEHATEDKAELERRRLLAMASSPEDPGEEDGPVVPPIDTHIPSAPVIEDDDFTPHTTPNNGPSLPVYLPRDS